VTAVALAAVGGVIGLGYTVHGIVSPDEPTGPTGSTVATEPQGRDAIAAASMLEVAPQDARVGTPSTATTPTITVPTATRVGTAEVPTGFPHTPEGAVGQLAAIAATVLQSMSLETTTVVHNAWADDGASAVEDWALTSAVQAFLGSAAGAWVDDPGTSLVTLPVAGQVKGVDGSDWVVACVLFEVTATVVTQARTAFGHCERMAWVTDRWVIAPGAAAAAAPSTWPGTDIAAAAGWRTWVASGE
jgi:hypothetical protein